jgi:SAM-dependent methyltransferase
MKVISLLKLKHVDQYSLDDPSRTLLHRDIILTKPFLKKLYEEWYAIFVKTAASLPEGVLVELGSGGGFLKEVLPQVITSDILALPNCDTQFSALDMPFEAETVSAIFMVDVFHHIPDSEKFLTEAERVLKPGGKIVMVEPANSVWGRFIYKNFHHEPFEPVSNWTIPSSGPMSGANGALPWIVFERDRATLDRKFPRLAVKSIRYHTPLRYLLSGGVSMRPLVPDWSFAAFRGIESLLKPVSRQFSMFQTIEVVKQ